MIVIACVLAGVAGAVLLSIAVTLVHQLIIPEALADGQYFFIWFVTLPIGVVLGAVSGAGICAILQHKVVLGAKICVIGGAIMGLFLGFLTLLTVLSLLGSGSIQQKRWNFRLGFPLYAIPLLWALFLFIKGWTLLR